MRSSPDRRRCAFTLVEVMTVLLLIVIIMALVMFGLSAAKESARRTKCLSNLKQLALGFREYSAEYHALPSVHTNVWTLVGDYVGHTFHVGSPSGFATNDDADVGEIYRCPADAYTSAVANCSYAPNFQDAPDTEATVVNGADQGNWGFSPWSNFKLDDSMNPVTSPDRLLRTASLADAAVDTIFLTECWSRSNVISTTHYQSTPLPPIWDYGDLGGVSPARDVLTSASDAGTYLMLESFGARAGASGGQMRLARDVYHRGTVSVVFADMHTESIEAINLASKLPCDTPIWTRQED